MNRYWKEENGVYELHFEQYYQDNIVLKFIQDNADTSCYWYTSEMLRAEDDCEVADNIDEAKTAFEEKVRLHIEDQVTYYEEMLRNWDEE